MTDRKRIITVIKQQIALCGPDPEKDRIFVYMTADDCRRIVDWLDESPIEPEYEGDSKSTWWYVCGECHGDVDPSDKYCRYCGRRILWTTLPLETR